MISKIMKILIIEDDVEDCNNFINAVKNREDIEIVGITDSDVEALQYVRGKRPEGIVLDLELNNSKTGNVDSIDFVRKLRNLKLGYEPIVIVTTHVNSKRIYDILHRDGVDLILYKDQPKYSSEYVLNKFISLRRNENVEKISISEKITNDEERISDLIYHELELVGISAKLKGRQYVHDAILFLIQNENSDINVIQYLTNVYKKPGSTITNGIQNAIVHGWRVSAVEDLEKYYTAKINYETGLPTPMEFIYYYADKIKKII